MEEINVTKLEFYTIKTFLFILIIIITFFISNYICNGIWFKSNKIDENDIFLFLIANTLIAYFPLSILYSIKFPKEKKKKMKIKSCLNGKRKDNHPTNGVINI